MHGRPSLDCPNRADLFASCGQGERSSTPPLLNDSSSVAVDPTNLAVCTGSDNLTSDESMVVHVVHPAGDWNRRDPSRLPAYCQNSESPARCFSVQSAVHLVQKWRAGMADMYNESAGVVTVWLHPETRFNCSILLSSESTAVNINSNVGPIAIATVASPGCPRSILQQHTPTNEEPFFVLSNATQVLLKALEFHIPKNGYAMCVVQSRLVKIDQCQFYVTSAWWKHSTIFLNSSYAVFLVRSRMEREPTTDITYVITLGKFHEIRSFVRVHRSVNSSEEVPVDLGGYSQWLTDNGTDMAMGLALKKMEQFKHNQPTRHQTPCLARFLLAIQDSVFANAGVRTPGYSQQEYHVYHLKGSAVHIETYPSVHPSFAFIHNNTFANLSSPEGSPVFLHARENQYGSRNAAASRRHVLISNCTFINNTAMLGGGVSMLFDRRIIRATAAVIQSRFLLNKARQGGGAFFARFSRAKSCVWMRNVEFVRNTVISTVILGAALSLWGPPGAVKGKVDCFEGEFDEQFGMENGHFEDNHGVGALCLQNVRASFFNSTSILNNNGTGLVVQQSMATFMGSVRIENNTGDHGGAIQVSNRGRVDFSKATSLSILNNTAAGKGDAIFIDVYTSVSTFNKLKIFIGKDRYLPSCPVLLPANMDKEMRRKITTSNGAANTTSPAIFAGSWHKCYTSYGLLDDYPKDELPYCDPYPPADWSYIKQHQTTEINCSANSPHSLHGADGQAKRGGNYFLGNESKLCHTACQNFTVVSKLGLFAKKIKTVAAWMFFEEATTSCYKQLPGKVWYFRRKCSRKKIFDFALNDRRSQGQVPRYDCSAFALAGLHERYRTSTTSVLPGYPLLLTPWRSLMHYWNSYTLKDLSLTEAEPRQVFNEACKPDKWHTLDPNFAMGDLTLYPAPGEQFDLTLNVADEFLSIVRSTLMLELTSTDNVLLHLDGKDYGPNERLFFSSIGSMRGLSLSGIPGSTGELKATLIGQAALRFSIHRFFWLNIPFKLRSCFPGFRDPMLKDYKEAAEYVKNEDLWRKGAAVGKSKISKLHCRCPDNLDGITRCEKGRNLIVKKGYWAGRYTKGRQAPLDDICVYDESEFIDNSSELTGDTCDFRSRSDFGVGVCDSGLCISNGDEEMLWTMPGDEPCRDKYKRTGVLCSGCHKDQQVMIASEICHNCTDSAARISIHTYLFLVFICSAMLFTVVLVLNIGVSPVLNSWLFFIQAVFIIFADHVLMRNIFYSAMTFGLGHICIKESMSVLQTRAVLGAQPLFIVLFSCLMWLAVRHGLFARHLQHLQRRNSLAHVIWLSVIYCTATIAYISTYLLASVTLHSPAGERRVLFLDGSVEFLGTEHLPYGITAIAALVFLVAPAPIVMALPSLRSLPQFKWYADEAMNMYEPGRHWWVSVDMFRRLLLAVMQGGIYNSRVRQYTVCLTCVILLTMHVMFRPLKRNKKVWKIADIDNKFETLLLFDLCLMSLIKISISCASTGKSLLDQNSVRYIVLLLYSIPTLLSLIITAYRFARSFQATYGRQEANQRYNMEVDDCLTMAMSDRPYGSPDGCAATTSPVSNSSATVSSSFEGLRHLPLHAQRRKMNTLSVPDGLRDPLLIEHLLSPAPPSED
ncbi:uncharacterized protein LOC135808624 isoform X2 [Sycon ciliatum]|uniref:uncharacterized protein LOC135808624 isoform X2 n=1 Tax=Sycon ciliatum TaxID=27933 RepID=UPI0031F6F9AF